MANVFNINNNDDDDDDYMNTKLNMDDLYESKQKKDISKLTIYKKMLQRIHIKIKTTCRTSKDQLCWFVVPEFILGVPHYDQPSCIQYVISQLEENGFKLRYNHPNVLFISWGHWIPSYVRTEIKKKTGVEVDGYGNVVEKKKKESDINNLANKKHTYGDKKDYKDISTYKPSGKFIYDDIFK
jgi:hypothetical protein|uniref:Uncharacterized protein n=1 Tax=viral metagenome TaxID=1070528 RepID=A0A6C0LFV6_9ZZZZ|tara:strand:+ start:1340 stop:1888 length:549 start_codon:yes stop_codon:yes gene_type:complete